MRITQFSDYSMRVLLYLGLKDDRAQVSEIAKAFRISRHHLVKVVHRLSQEGLIQSFKGRNGGIALAVDPSRVRIGELLRKFEPMDLLECFAVKTNTCPIQGHCQLERTLYKARSAFLKELDQHTLADFLAPGAARDTRARKLGLG